MEVEESDDEDESTLVRTEVEATTEEIQPDLEDKLLQSPDENEAANDAKDNENEESNELNGDGNTPAANSQSDESLTVVSKTIV